MIAIVTTSLAVAGVQESRDPDAEHLDVAGIATLSISVRCVAFYITQGPDFGFSSATGLAIVATSSWSFLAFVLAETRNARPMFDFSVFRIRTFSGARFWGRPGMSFSFWPFMIYLPIFFRSALGYGNVAAGLALLAYTLPTLVVPPFGERILLRFGGGIAIPSGLFVIGLDYGDVGRQRRRRHVSWLTLLPGCFARRAQASASPTHRSPSVTTHRCRARGPAWPPAST